MLRGSWKAAVLSVVLCAFLIALLTFRKGAEDTAAELLLYCAAGMKTPVEIVAKEYQREHGVKVQIQYGGSGTLLSAIEVAQRGDLFVAADESYTRLGREKGLVAEVLPVAQLKPVLAVTAGNPKDLQSILDLMREDVRVSLANPEAASIGKVTQQLLTAAGAWEAVKAAVTTRGVFKPTVNDVANDIKIGAVDAGIVWDATVQQYAGIERIVIDPQGTYTQTATIGVLTASAHPTDALRFARYLTASDRGLPVFADQGFPAVEGDAWAWTPEILYFSGGVNRVAIEQTIKDFEQREGCKATTVYNGCGILLGQLKLGEEPDVYHTCDGSFMRGVEERFDAPLALSRTAIVIIVPKGNPRRIAVLADLAQPSLKLGLAHEEQSTLGWLTAELLKSQGLYETVTKNVVANTPTADLLVAQLVAGGLDAAIVYEASTKKVTDRAELIHVPLPNAMATQTYAIAKNTTHRRLMERFLERLRSVEGRDRFLSAGFEIVGEK